MVAGVLSSCGSLALEHSLSSCGVWTCLLHGLWDLPKSEIKALSPALAGRFLFTESPGKPWSHPNQIWVPSVLVILPLRVKSPVVPDLQGPPRGLSPSPATPLFPARASPATLTLQSKRESTAPSWPSCLLS